MADMFTLRARKVAQRLTKSMVRFMPIKDEDDARFVEQEEKRMVKGIAQSYRARANARLRRIKKHRQTLDMFDE